MDRPKPSVKSPVPEDIADKADLVGRIELLFQLVPLIIQTDSSRVISIVIQNNHGIPLINGVAAEHHNLSHHGRDPKKIAQLLKIETAIMGCFGNLLHRLVIFLSECFRKWAWKPMLLVQVLVCCGGELLKRCFFC